MSFTSWLRNLRSPIAPDQVERKHRRRRSLRATTHRPYLEVLEDRSLPSFLAPVSYAAGPSPSNCYAVVTADFNRDGRLDVVVANYSNNTVSVLLGNADGTFQPARTSATGSGPLSVAVGDFNADGKLDLATANLYDVSALLGNGDGTFQTPTSIDLGLGSGLSSVAAGDFNADGKLDLAVTSNVYGYADYASVLLSNGDGSFSGPRTADMLGYHSSAAVADFNGDGKLDLVAVSTDGIEAVSVLLGDGTGTLQGATDFSTGGIPVSVAVGDVNGDGHTDLVTVNAAAYGYNPRFGVLLGNGQGGFAAVQNYYAYAGNSVASTVVLGDFNNDGNLDIATVDPNANKVVVALGQGDGTFAPPRSSATDLYPQVLATGDFNGDGSLDAATADGYDVSVLINAADWSATPAQASSFVVSGFPSATTAGTAGTFTVTAENADGTTAIGYGGTVHFTSSDAQAGLPADYTFTAADAGVHAFSATLKTAGTQSLTATDTATASITGTENGITVSPGAASMFLVAGFPSSTTAGVGHSFTITARDPYGNVATSYTGTVHFSSSDGKAALPGKYTFTAADAGLHTFIATLKTAGTQSITVKDTGTAGLSGTEGGITVNPAAATQLVLSAPSSVNKGAEFSLTLTVEDAYGNVVTGYVGTLHFTSSDGTATLPVTYSFTAADAGVHTFVNASILRKKGKQTITVTDTQNSALTATDAITVV